LKDIYSGFSCKERKLGKNYNNLAIFGNSPAKSSLFSFLVVRTRAISSKYTFLY